MADTARLRTTWPLLTIPLVWLFVFGGVWLAGQGLRPLGLNVAMNGRWQDALAALFASLPVIACLWLWLRLWERRGLADVGLTQPVVRDLRRGFVIGAVLTFAAVAIGLLLGGYHVAGPGAWQGPDLLWLTAAVLAVAGTLVQATVTEVLWRGWMLQTVAAKWGPVAAVAFNIAATVALQAGNLLRSPEAFVWTLNMALMAGLLSLRTLRDGDLWGAVGLHAAWNLVIGLGLGLPIDGGWLGITPLIVAVGIDGSAPGLVHGGLYGPDGSLAMTAAIGAAFLWSLRGKGTAPIARSYGRHRDDDHIDDH